MGLRHRRLLPSVLVGGMLVAGMAIGVGTAEAQESCTGPTGLTILLPSPLVESVTDSGKCVLATVEDTTSSVPTPTPSKIVTPPSGSTTSSTAAPPTTPPSTTVPVPPAAQPPGAAAAAPAAVAAAQPLAAGQSLLAPGVGATPSALTGAPFAPALGNAVYDPALLLGAPANNPLVSMASADPASAVTTASQVQAMALQNLPGGLGVPAVLGVIILAGLGALVVRSRILRRVKKAAATS